MTRMAESNCALKVHVVAEMPEADRPLGGPRPAWKDNIRRAREEAGARGSLVVKALRYKPAGRGFDSRWRHWNFSVT